MLCTCLRRKVRSMAILSAIMGFPAFTKERTLLEQVQMLERLGDEYQRTSGTNISDDILLTTLVRALPRGSAAAYTTWDDQRHDLSGGQGSCGRLRAHIKLLDA